MENNTCDALKIKGVVYIKADSEKEAKKKFEALMEKPTVETMEKLDMFYSPGISFPE